MQKIFPEFLKRTWRVVVSFLCVPLQLYSNTLVSPNFAKDEMPYPQKMDRLDEEHFQVGKSAASSNSQNLHPFGISPLESERLNRVLYFLFARHSFGYTLFGEKPISFCFVPSKSRNVLRLSKQTNPSFYSGLKIFRDFLQNCPQNNFCIHFFEQSDRGSVLAVIINKKSVENIFKKNEKIFKKCFFEHITYELLLRLLGQEDTYQKLFDSHLILGILLGYGKNNSELFQKRSLLQKKLQSISANASFKDAYAKLDGRLNTQPQKDFWTSIVSPVYFASDPTLHETVLLKQEYQRCHEVLTEIFKQKNWSELVLKALSE